MFGDLGVTLVRCSVLDVVTFILYVVFIEIMGILNSANDSN